MIPSFNIFERVSITDVKHENNTLSLFVICWCDGSVSLRTGFVLIKRLLVSQISILTGLPWNSMLVVMKSIPIVGWILFCDFPVAEYKNDVFPTLTSPTRITTHYLFTGYFYTLVIAFVSFFQFSYLYKYEWINVFYFY